MTTIYDLPQPTPTALQRSDALSDHLRCEIDRQDGLISFATFMEAALYHPEFGYYTNETFTLGARGDFTTAPVISPLFAKCFARQLAPLLALFANKKILEIGAGTGQFAFDLLCELEQLGCLPVEYYIYEISLSLRKKQQDFLQTTCPTLFSRIIWLAELPANFVGLIVANEVLDALPFHLFHLQDNKIKERCVSWQNNKFAWASSDTLTQALIQKAQCLEQKYQFEAGYESEINLYVQAFIEKIANCLSSGIILFADYGYDEQAYYHPERRNGTLTCFYQHKKHANPLIWPGLQDITAHVNFTQIAESACAHNCTLEGYTTQAAFLLNTGLIEIAEEQEKKLNSTEQFELRQAIKLLTLPTEMGERVKMMALSKHLNSPPPPVIRLQVAG